jgi:hypothetical protein
VQKYNQKWKEIGIFGLYCVYLQRQESILEIGKEIFTNHRNDESNENDVGHDTHGHVLHPSSSPGIHQRDFSRRVILSSDKH